MDWDKLPLSPEDLFGDQVDYKQENDVIYNALHDIGEEIKNYDIWFNIFTRHSTFKRVESYILLSF